MGSGSCPSYSVVYNGTLCACLPGYLLNSTSNSCSLFNVSSDIYTNSVDDYFAVSFPETLFSFDSIKKFTQSQAVFLEATITIVLCWLVFCFCLRLPKIGDRGNRIFRARWWISRLDVCYSTKHWLDDQQPVVKRKTELGGTFSIASWILFVGLFSAALYQIISKRTIEIHNVRAISAPDLASFMNDMEFNITTLSSMSCSNIFGLGRIVSGNPGILDQRQFDLIQFVNYSCYNTSTGPKLNFKCSNCQFLSDYMSVSWQFVDLPSVPAAAVGFQFNFSSNGHVNKKHNSVIGGILKNASSFTDRPVTFRGQDSNILKFNLFPQIYHNLNDLKLIQPVFQEFISGSYIHEASNLRASLESPGNGLVNVTLIINLLSAYVVEIDNRSIMGPVSFLADLGGLYCFSISIFFYFLVQFEHRIKKLRSEDAAMRRIRNRKKAVANWDKLRKYVAYTWSCSSLDHLTKNSGQEDSSCFSSAYPVVKRKRYLHEGASSWKDLPQQRKDSISFNKRTSKSNRNVSLEVGPNTIELQGGTNDLANPQDTDRIPPPPPVEINTDLQADITDIHKNLQQMYSYNVMLREKLMEMEKQLHSLKHPSSPTNIEKSSS